MSGPFHQTYSWDGTNLYGAPCASGVYILELTGPLLHQLKKIILIH